MFVRVRQSERIYDTIHTRAFSLSRQGACTHMHTRTRTKPTYTHTHTYTRARAQTHMRTHKHTQVRGRRGRSLPRARVLLHCPRHARQRTRCPLVCPRSGHADVRAGGGCGDCEGGEGVDEKGGFGAHARVGRSLLCAGVWVWVGVCLSLVCVYLSLSLSSIQSIEMISMTY